MNFFIQSFLVTSTLCLVACGSGSDSTAIVQSSSLPKNTHIDEQAQCYEPNVISTSKVRVIDGDTVEVIPVGGKSERVRLLGIDAPEAKQDYGTESTNALIQCLNNKQVTIEWTNRDRYDRLLGKVIANQIDCNLNQVKKGLAWHYKEYQSNQTPFDRIEYSNGEVGARSKHLGLWVSMNPVKPSDYRHGTEDSENSFNNKIVSSKNASQCYTNPSS